MQLPDLRHPRSMQTLFAASAIMLAVSLTASALNVAAVLSAPLGSPVTVPNLVGFEGYLTDGEGDPLPDDTYDLTFRVYAVAVDGTALYTETQTITTAGGLYSALIGAVTTLPANLFDGERWIGVTVDQDDELTPRTRVASVPFALNAENANTAGSAESAEAVAWAGVTGKPAGFADGIDNDSGGDITGVGAGTGLAGGGASGSVTLSADTSYLQRRVSSSCSAGNYLRVINSDGTVTCGADADSGGDVTGVTAGYGLSGGGTSGNVTLAVVSTTVQSRVTGACGAGQYMQSIAQAGTVTCGGLSGYVFVPLTSPWTSTSWDGDAKNTGTYTIDVSSFSGAPGTTASIKAYYVRILGNWSSAGGGATFFGLKRLTGDSFHSLAVWALVANANEDGSGIVTADTNGDFIAEISGANAASAWIQIWGYYQ
ncbi:MAG: hypothetical protein IT318_19555 [Anaerolineales bacterium]|nr:hypothetical protein [Anaerolineales bacterium]